MTPRAYTSMEKVVAAIESGGPMTCEQIEKIVRLSATAVYDACMKGVSHGFLKRTFLARELRKGRKLVLFSRTQKKYKVPSDCPKPYHERLK